MPAVEDENKDMAGGDKDTDEKKDVAGGDADKEETTKVNDPEDEKESYRIYAAISYAVVLIVIGMPLWWKTTEVYRVSLPYTKIAELDGLDTKLAMNISISTLDPPRGEKLAADLTEIFKTSKLFKLNFLTKPLEKQYVAAAHSPEDLENASFQPTLPGELLLLEIPGLARFTPNQVLAGVKRTVYFSSDTSAIKLSEILDLWLLQEKSLRQTVAAMTAPTETDQDRTGRRRVPAAAEYDIMVTVVNPEPEKLHLDWDLPEAVKDFMQPFLHEVSPIAGYTVKSQWLYFVTLNVQPKLVTDSGYGRQHYALAEDILPQIITPLEKKLASHVSKNPCLNFVVYIPSCDAAALHIYRRQGIRVKGGVDAFLSPRWGGIVIHNPSTFICDNESIPEPKVYSPDAASIMGVFLAQMRLLMGIPELSLSQLLGEISNIVINDAVGDSIFKAVDAVERAAHYLSIGHLGQAFNESKQAFLSAEAAFTDPSLLALLYFPDDQKYAVYIPLFLPVMIPVIMSLKNINSWLFRRSVPKIKVKKD
ncbi:GPI transamidase component PIG-S [Blattella germanica]|nr:GPI transamidase component PIG-S [Blattella germanica]